MLPETSNKQSGQGGHNANSTLIIVIEGKQFEWHEQFITGLQAKELRGLPLDSELYLGINEPWKDELVNNNDRVDLARPGIEQFFIKQKLKFTINGKEFESVKQYVKVAEVRKRGDIAASHQIFLSIRGPWEDELLKDEEFVDLARPGIEHFYSKEEVVKVIIIVNGREKRWNEKLINFKEVVTLAFGSYTDDPNKVYTVTYSKGPKENPEGTMVKGDKVFVKNKMVFNVTATNKS